VILVLFIIGTLASDPKPDTTAGQAPTTAPATQPPPTDTEAVTTETEPPTTEKPTTTAKPKPRVLFSQSGGGTHSLRAFQAPDNWRLQWSYDCKNFAQYGGGNFIVSDEGGESGELNINELGKGGHGEEFIDTGGRIKIQVVSTCNRWTLKALSQ
jgi:hypothetical protein